MFHCVFRLEEYEVITGLLEKLLPKSMYQMFCFRLLQNSEDITPHYFPEKLLLALKTYFHGLNHVSLPLGCFRSCFSFTSLDTQLPYLSGRKYTYCLYTLLY